MPLITRLRLIQVKLEAEKGTAVTPDTDVLVWDIQCDPEAEFVERKLSGIVMGHTSPGLQDGSGAGKISFKAEFRTATAAATLDAGLAVLFQCCGILKTSEVYTPTSVYTSQKTCTIAYFKNGKRNVLSGCMGNLQLVPDGNRLVCEFEFSGVWGAPTDAALPTPTYTAALPLMWSATANAFTLNAVALALSTFNFNLGNAVTPLVNGGRISHYMVTDRDPVITMDPEEKLCATYDAYAAWLAGTTHALSMAVGNGSYKVTLAVPKFQHRNPKEGDRNGLIVTNVTGQCNFNTAGDDEWSMTVAAA